MSNNLSEKIATGDLVNASIPIFVISVLVELWIDRKGGKFRTYRFNNAISSMSLGAMQELFHILFINALMIVPYVYVWDHYALHRLSDRSFLTFLLAFVGTDFAYYWFHRGVHEWNLGWATHVSHHSSEDYNFTTALRQGALQYSLGWLFYLPMALFVPPRTYAVLQQLNRLYQFWLHTQYIPRMNWLIEGILVTPSAHRVHHGSNAQYIDKNYGGTLILWDRLFGTYEPEGETVRYGITKNLGTWNPLYANVHIYYELLQATKFLNSWNKLQLLWRGPGWTFLQLPTAEKEKHVAVKAKYDTFVPTATKAYILAVFASCAVLSKLLGSGRLTGSHVYLAAGWIFSSLTSIGLLMDKKSWAVTAEVFRWLAFIVAVVFFYAGDDAHNVMLKYIENM